MSRVFLTGATGLVGRAVVAHLPRNVELCALSRRPPDAATEPRIDWRAGDLDQPECLRGMLAGCRAVIHCAGVMGSDEANFRLNRDGTRALHEEACRAGVQHFVHVSSCVVYGDEDHLHLTEDAPRSGASSYARSKIAAEDLLLAAPRAGAPVACIARPCMITGPGDRNLVPAVRALLAQPTVPLPGFGEKRLDLVLASDLGQLLVRMALDSSASGAFNVTSGQPRTVREWMQSAAAALGASRHWRALSQEEFRRELEQRAREGSLSPLDGALYSLTLRERTYSIARARQTLGFAPDGRDPLRVALA